MVVVALVVALVHTSSEEGTPTIADPSVVTVVVVFGVVAAAQLSCEAAPSVVVVVAVVVLIATAQSSTEYDYD